MKNLLPEKITQIIPMYESALLELFELHKYEIIPLNEFDELYSSVNGISYDIIPHERFSAISFRKTGDYKVSGVANLDLQYSPADWEHYTFFEYDTSKSQKFREVSEYIFQLYEELYAKNDDDEYHSIQQDINHLIFLAIAEAVLQPSVTNKLSEYLTLAPTLIDEPDGYSFEYMVTDMDKSFNFNYCELIIADRMTKKLVGKLTFD